MKFLKPKILIAALFFAGIILSINLTGFTRPVKNFFYSFSEPLQSFFWKTGKNISDFGAGFLYSQNIKRENDVLQNINKELLAELLLLREIKNENEFLKQGMGIQLDKEFNLILAQVVSKDIFRDSILINRGLTDGIKKNQPVITAQRTLIGKIGEVYEKFSEVVLISNSDFSFDVKISETDTSGVIRGKGRSIVRLELVPKDKELKRGNFIVSTALGGIFPEGILVGEIKDIENSDTNPFQSASVNPSFDLGRLDRIFVIENFNSLK